MSCWTLSRLAILQTSLRRPCGRCNFTLKASPHVPAPDLIACCAGVVWKAPDFVWIHAPCCMWPITVSTRAQVGCPSVTMDFDGSVVPGCGSNCQNIAVHDCLSSAGQSGSAIWSGNGTSNMTVRVCDGAWYLLTQVSVLGGASRLLCTACHCVSLYDASAYRNCHWL